MLVHTNNNAYAYKAILLQPAAKVKVPAAALFSNTKYATLWFGLQTGFSHTLNFKSTLPGISIGYTTSKEVTLTVEFKVNPDVKTYIGRKHYANTYWDDRKSGGPGIVSTGISAEVETWDWSTYETREYIDPTSLKEGYMDFQLISGTTKKVTYKETGTRTLSASLGIDFAIQYKAFGIPLGLDVEVAVTSSRETWVAYEIYNDSGGTLIFRVYTPGAIHDPENKIGGVELHVWNMNGTG